VGPARADLYFGAGAEAGRVAGRLKNNARFVMLVPKGLDPLARGRRLPVPDERPAQKIAKLFPQGGPLRDQPKAATGASPAASTQAVQATSAQASVPLPAARPKDAPMRDAKRRRPSRDR
jgi:membrane-bound lytic murein transglycosylase A